MAEHIDEHEEIDQQLEDEQLKDLKHVEESILSIINKIKKDRNRACVQNIHTFIQRRGIKMEVEKLKEVMEDLMLRNVIVDKGREGKESFLVVNLTSQGDQKVENIISSEHETSFNALHEFIDDSFDSTLIKKIKSEVKLAMQEFVNHDAIQKYTNEKNETSLKDKCLPDLITTLKDQITFLRNEIQSKDKIIELMIKDKFNDNAEKKVNFVAKSTVTNTESKIGLENTARDKNIKISEEAGSKNKRTTVILGDSIIKDVEQYKIRKGLNNKERVFVKHFAGATVDDMKNYIIPSKKYENDLVILHMGTNDLKNPKSAKEIATEIVELAIDMKTEQNEIMISGIVPRRDNLNEKAIEVNRFLQSSCSTYNFYFIDNGNINRETHLNLSGLHLNHNGTYVLGSNFVGAIRL